MNEEPSDNGNGRRTVLVWLLGVSGALVAVLLTIVGTLLYAWGESQSKVNENQSSEILELQLNQSRNIGHVDDLEDKIRSLTSALNSCGGKSP